MGKLWVALAGTAAALFAGPLVAVLVLTTVLMPAENHQQQVVSCEQVPTTGDWRPPLQQAYTVRDDTSGPQVLSGGREDTAGVELTGRTGPGTVVAAAAGTVATAAQASDLVDVVGTADGLVVQIQHADGVVTRYSHLASIDASVRPAAAVAAGQVLGIEGATGTSTGRHLLFEVVVDGAAVDPVPFMADRGAPLNGQPPGPSPTLPSTSNLPSTPGVLEVEGGIGFTLPPPSTPRRASLTNPPQPIPAAMRHLYESAGTRYQLPWTLLAGVGMIETNHGRLTATSSAGARGPMQFMPATFAEVGVDGDGDGRADIDNSADSVFSAANYLTRSGVANGPDGVRAALYAYNHADWYVNDVLFYADAYGGGTVLGDPTQCPPGQGDPSLPPLTDERLATVLGWASDQVGEPYVYGANGPDAWDCSSFSRTAFAQIGVTMPRTAAAQRDWLAAGNGYQIQLGQERPGDLIFYSSYLGPGRIGHVILVWDPATRTSIEAQSSATGVGRFTYADDIDRPLFQIWRVGNVADRPAS